MQDLIKTNSGSGRLCFAFLVALGLVLASPVAAQLVTAITDISPSNAPGDGLNPNRATGGRVNGTAVDPNNKMILYAASEYGGIFKSVDGGDKWFRLTGHRPRLTWDVAVDPANSNRVYATSHYDGKSAAMSQSGINVSNDGGATWTHPATAVPPANFCATAADQTELTAFGIAFDPNNSANVFIGTSCGLARSTDSGATWTWLKPSMAASSAGRIWGLVHSTNAAVRFVDTCGDAGHAFLNVASGAWTVNAGLPTGRCSIAVSPYSATNFNLFAVVGITFYETTDGGSTWVNTRANPSPQGRIPFVSTNRRSTLPAGQIFDLWFGDTSLHSVTCNTAASPRCFTSGAVPWNGGFTTANGGHDDMGSILFDPSAANDACPILMSSDGGVYRNLDNTSPSCHTAPMWEQPTITPHGMWPWALAGADVAGADSEDLYFGNQDNGVFGTINAGATNPTWTDDICCDGFDAAADDAGANDVVYSVCCFGGGGRSTRFRKKGANFTGGGEFTAYPAGGLPPGFKFPDVIVNWADKSYAMITNDCNVGVGGCPGADGGVYITTNIDAGTIVWTELGNASEPQNLDFACAIRAGTTGGVPTFYVQTGNCNAATTTDRVFKFTGTNPAGTWTEINLPSGGFGIFTVNEANPSQLLAAGFTAADALTYKSTDGGASWTALAALDTLMRGGGDFPIVNSRGATNMGGYHQPSLVAIDPTDSNIMVAGGRDSGVFLSTNAGTNWSLVTDPRDSHISGKPHIPRPWHAYFDAEAGGAKNVFLSSVGGGVWRLTLSATCPANVTLSGQTVDATEYYQASASLTTGPTFTVGGTGDFAAQAPALILTNDTNIFGTATLKNGTCP